MRLTCASAKIRIEDCEDNSTRIDREGMSRQYFSSDSASVAQDEHSFMRKIST
jgi:hypothetical protein